MASSMDLDNDHFDRLSDDFMRWLRQSDPRVKVHPGIAITDLRAAGAGRGICALRDISEDEELFVVPENLILSIENSKAMELLGLDDKELGPWLSLIVAMIYEYRQGGNSAWAPYLRILPTSFDTLMFWTEDQLRELRGSAVLDKIGKAAADETILEKVVPMLMANPQHFPARPDMPPFDHPDCKNALLELAHRMGSLIMAYAFDIDKNEEAEDDAAEDGYITDEEDEPAKGMVPLADIFNADAHRNNARLFQEEGSFVMKAIKNIHAGDEIFNDYGELPRADLLRRYGYVTDNYAQYDVVEFSLESICKAAGLPSSSPSPSNSQLELLDNFDLLEDGYAISRIPDGESLEDAIPEDLVVLLRTLSLSTEEFNQLQTKNKPPKPVFSSAEATLLQTLVTQRQTDYPTTIEEDDNLLRNISEGVHNLDDVHRRRQMMAVQVRKGEKEILVQVLGLLNTYLRQQGQNEPSKRGTANGERNPKRQRQT